VGAAKLAVQKTRKPLETTWQRRADPLDRVQWRAGHAVSARFRVLSSEIGGQEFFPIRNPIGFFWKGK
jgi:hypothetical protein